LMEQLSLPAHHLTPKACPDHKIDKAWDLPKLYRGDHIDCRISVPHLL
jgi:hypothetical protein